MMTADEARALFSYDEDAGNLRWRDDHPAGRGGKICHVKAGDIAGYAGVAGFEIRYGGRKYRAHRLIWLILYGRWPTAFIDHINGNPLDNRRSNIREATPAQNALNKRVRKDSAHGVKGVTLLPGRKKPWQAQISVGGIRKTLGYFHSASEAHAAYCAAAAELHGEFANTGDFHP